MSRHGVRRPKRRKRQVCCDEPGGCGPEEESPTTLAEVVAAYIRWHRPHAEEERAWFARGDRDDAISRAALAEIDEDGKRHPHQYRIPRSQLEAARNELLVNDLSSVTTFDRLHRTVAEAIGPIERIGELAIYDTADRIGAFLGLAPLRVYLHRGTRDGARALGLGRGRPSLDVEELPVDFRQLQPYEIEDCLCIYKEALARIAVAGEPAKGRMP